MAGTRADFLVVGGGLVGLSTAYSLVHARPGSRVVVVEKEAGLAQHQSGHNSGVIHAGVYYEPGSLKARLCRAGHAATLDFCRAHQVPYELCGKLIVATNRLELERLKALERRAIANEVAVEWLEGTALRQREPHIAGLAALHVAATGMVDYPALAARLGILLRNAGVAIECAAEVTKVREREGQIELETARGAYVGKHLIVCAGLHADRLARLAGLVLEFAVVPFRGDYFRLAAGRAELIRHHIYPVPDPTLPFLGIHLTRLIDGGISVGPSAMLAFAREGYRLGQINLGDLAEMACFPGVWRLLARHARAGLAELRCAISKSYYLKEVQKYCPTLNLDDLQPHPSGVRAQAVSREGYLLHDFLIRNTARATYVCNAPSPAATAALPIGVEIVRQVLARTES